MKFRSTGGRLFRRCLTRTNEYQLDNLIFKLQMEHRVRAAANCPQPLKEECTMTKVEKAVQWMEAIAADNTHGYSTVKRWGPDYDCSSFVISAFEQAGIPVKTKGASFTGNIKAIFTSLGFKDVTNAVNKNTGAGIQRGDVLLNTLFHVAVSQGNGKLVHARSNDGHFASGDQSGKEIRRTSTTRGTTFSGTPAKKRLQAAALSSVIRATMRTRLSKRLWLTGLHVRSGAA